MTCSRSTYRLSIILAFAFFSTVFLSVRIRPIDSNISFAGLVSSVALITGSSRIRVIEVQDSVATGKTLAPVSICIGTTFRHLTRCLDGFLSWLFLSSKYPGEIIIAVSEAQNYTHIREIFDPSWLKRLAGVRLLLLLRDDIFNQASNRNLAASYANFKILMFWDMDDIMHAQRLALIVDHFATFSDSSALLHRFITQDKSDGQEIRKFVTSDPGLQVYENISYRDAQKIYLQERERIPYGVFWCCLLLKDRVENIDYHNAWVSVRKSVFMQNRFNESWSMYRAEDSDLTMRLFLRGFNVSLSRLQLGLYMSSEIKELPVYEFN